jgi:hypothetical protein
MNKRAAAAITSSFAGAALLATEACTVPHVTFIADAADATEDAGPADGSVSDSGAPTDAGGNCPDAIPDGASYCCDSVPCHGVKKNCVPSCSDCTTYCKGMTCCLKNGRYASCAPDPASCP